MVQARSPRAGLTDSINWLWQLDRRHPLDDWLLRWAVVVELGTDEFSEVEMQAKMFDRPVYLRERKDLVLEITNLDDAIDFLEEWSKGDRDIIHDATLKTGYLAHDGHKTVQVGGCSQSDAGKSGKRCGLLIASGALFVVTTDRNSTVPPSELIGLDPRSRCKAEPHRQSCQALISCRSRFF